MIKNKKVLFLEASGGGGHISITTAIIQALRKANPEIEVARLDVIPRLAHRLYKVASRQFSGAYTFLFRATNNTRGEFFATKINSMINRNKLTQLISSEEPDLILSDSLVVKEIPLILKTLKRRIPFLVFVPDPFTAHTMYLSDGPDMTMVSTLAAYTVALGKGIDPKKLDITGHPVREEFYTKPKDIGRLRKSLGLDPGKFTILFGGSGHGAEKSIEILIHLGAVPSSALIGKLLKRGNLDYKNYQLLLRKSRQKRGKISEFQAICVCGDNEELKEDLGMLNYPNNIKPYIFMKPNNMADLVHAADLIVGKAGPNIIFESIAAKKPFLATCHIKGQEDGNIAFIRSTQVGFVEENSMNSARLIKMILKDNDLLKITELGIDNIYRFHKGASGKIAKHILNYLNFAQ